MSEVGTGMQGREAMLEGRNAAAKAAANFLHLADPSIPRIALSLHDFDVLPQYLGPGYGHPTAPSESA